MHGAKLDMRVPASCSCCWIRAVVGSPGIVDWRDGSGPGAADAGREMVDGSSFSGSLFAFAASSIQALSPTLPFSFLITRRRRSSGAVYM